MEQKPPSKPKKGMSKKQNLIGFAVLGLSVLALLGVSWYGYQTFYGDNTTRTTTNGQKKSFFKRNKKTTQTRSLSPGTNKVIKPSDPKLVALKKQPRQEKIRFKIMEGNWIANTIDGVAVLKLSRDKKYRIVVINQENNERIYSQGNFDKRGDLLTFVPDRSIQPPNTVKGKPINSSRLTLSGFPIMVSKNAENIVWGRPSKDMGVFVPDEHALLNYFDEEIIVWKRMK